MVEYVKQNLRCFLNYEIHATLFSKLWNPCYIVSLVPVCITKAWPLRNVYVTADQEVVVVVGVCVCVGGWVGGGGGSSRSKSGLISTNKNVFGSQSVTLLLNFWNLFENKIKGVD